MEAGYHARIAGLPARFWIYLTWWVLFCTASVSLVVYWRWGRPIDTRVDPLLKGPPQFIVLAIVVALAAYLRQVALGATDLRDKIRHNKIWNYPMREPYFSEYTKEKIHFLEEIIENLKVASPFIILLFLAVAVRIVIDSLLRFLHDSASKPKWLFIVDFVIAEWLAVMFLSLMWTHLIARKKDENIGSKCRENEDKIHPVPQLTATAEASWDFQASVAQNQTMTRPRAGKLAFWAIAFGLSLLVFGAVTRVGYKKQK
jgi:hypothetical protein